MVTTLHGSVLRSRAGVTIFKSSALNRNLLQSFSSWLIASWKKQKGENRAIDLPLSPSELRILYLHYSKGFAVAFC